MRLSRFVDMTLPIGHREAQVGVQAHKIAGIKKPARSGPVFPDVVMCSQSISTLLRSQLIIGCVDQLPVIDRR